MFETTSKIGELIDQNKLLEQQNEELKKIIDINLTASKHSNSILFFDNIDINEVENLIIKFYQFNNIPTAIYDKNCKLLFSVGWKPVCVKYHHCRNGSENNCLESINNINNKLIMTRFTKFKCKNGLNVIAIPINVRDSHIATIVLNQFHYKEENINYDSFTKKAEELKFEQKKYLHEVESLPVFSSNEIEQIINNVTYLAELIGYLWLRNIETHEKAENHFDNELILSALRNKISEQEIILKSIFKNIIHHQTEIQENTISKSEQAKELEKLNEKFERTETILNSLLTSLPLGICFIRRGVFTFVNDHTFKLTGYTSKELAGRNIEFLFGTSTDYQKLFDYSTEYFIKSNHSIELNITTKDNRSINVIVFSSLFNNNDPTQGWIISMLDISAFVSCSSRKPQ